MPVFEYKAREASGEIRYGEVESPSITVAADVLRTRGLLVIDLNEERAAVTNKEITWFERINAKDLIFFSRQLSTMLGAQISLVRALEILAKQTRKKKFRELIENMVHDVDGGVKFSVALAQFPETFDRFYVSVIQAGEASGTVDDSLAYLAEHLGKNYDLRMEVQNALYYPAFILVAFIGVGILMLVYVVPQLRDVFSGMGKDLPWATQMLLFLGDTVKSWWWLIMILVAGIILGVRSYIRSANGRNRYDRLLLAIPRLGDMIKKVQMVRFANNLNTLLGGGVSILEALNIVSSVMGSSVYKEALADVVKRVEAGDSLASSLGRYPAFPSIVSQMVGVGEKTGKLSQVLKQISEFYTREVDNEVAGLSSLLEPVIMVVMGVGVGFLMISIIGPIYQASSGM